MRHRVSRWTNHDCRLAMCYRINVACGNHSIDPTIRFRRRRSGVGRVGAFLVTFLVTFLALSLR